uniref:Apolipoprotein D n=1 Tax=Gasterosteus aculeatus aculeatus TaxID=481459 RepID=G3PXV9_GASAC|nr:apolipoprotein D-like [Gasterosteus aculeatus aculeatus]
MKAMQVILLTLLVVLVTSAQYDDSCPKPDVQANFDVSKYLGKWYGIKKLPTPFQKGECSTAFYSLKSSGEIGVLNSGLLEDGTIRSAVATATVKDPSDPAKLAVSFSPESSAPYWVLSTDYEGHSLVYSCTNRQSGREYAWILSREPTLPEETVKKLEDVLSSIGIDVDKMAPTNQNENYCSVMRQ